eukprot:jgi/Ulvmu1/3804/UM018_0014.1
MRAKSLARLSLCQRGRRPNGAFVSKFALRRSYYGAKARGASMETMFYTAMHVRERYFALSARARPDDSAKLETLQHVANGKEHPAVVAFRNERLALGFSAGGLMFPYYIGIISSLSDLGIIQQSKTPIAGASAGSLIAACFHAGLPPGSLMEATLELAAALRKSGTYANLGPTLKPILHRHLPEDAHEACNDSTFVAITNISVRPSASLVSRFHSKEDLIDALLTSCHIPIYFNGNLTTTFRGGRAMDGGIFNFLPVPPAADYTARVCCFPSQNFTLAGNVHVSPDCFDATWADIPLQTLLSWALTPASDDVLWQLHDKGRADAAAWARLTGVGDAAAPDIDDWYRYNHLHEAVHVAPPVMSVDDNKDGNAA